MFIDYITSHFLTVELPADKTKNILHHSDATVIDLLCSFFVFQTKLDFSFKTFILVYLYTYILD